MFTGPARWEETLLRTKLSPPQLRRRVHPRPALTARLREALDYRLTVVQAGTGYSKTTALASLASADAPLFWYSIGEVDADPQRFLLYLIGAFQLRLPDLSALPLAFLQEGGGEGSRAAWTRTLDALVNALYDSLPGPSILVIDDYHLAAHSEEVNALVDRLVTYLPPDLHVIVSTRYPVNLPGLVGWRARGEVLEIGRQILAFGPDEIEALFKETYGIELPAHELTRLAEKTEGWPIALQLVWQGLRSGGPQTVGELTRAGSAPIGTLFDYLAREVLAAQPPEIARFLQSTAVLRELTPETCDAVLGAKGSGTVLELLQEMGLFVVALGDEHYRYHHLFHDFLRQQADANPEGSQEGHRRAAEFFEAARNYEEAIYHWLAARDPERAAASIESAGEAALRAGWLDTMALWIDSLPPAVITEHPLLQSFLGDVCRMRSRFDEALEWYRQAQRIYGKQSNLAGVGRALRGQALVYLDTVRPAQAESLLQEALRLSEGLADRESRARLLELMAENKLNMGKPGEAERLRAEARALREEGPHEDALSVRVKLRTGQLDEAQRTLESWAEAERREAELGHTHPPRAHRETILILSLIHAMRGEAGQAFRLAREGIELGTRLDSPFVTTVGHVRLGHAWLLRPGPEDTTAPPEHLEEAVRCYTTGVALGDRLAVRRIRAEAMWGLTRAYGFGGDLDAAERAAAEGVETGRWAGDVWIVALIELMLGASYVLAGRAADAVDILQRVLVAFRECGDTFGRAVARLWLALAYQQLGQEEMSAASTNDALALAEDGGYSFLFTRPTLLGPPDTRCLVPLLLAARSNGRRVSYANRLLAAMGLSQVTVHPGYRLRVYTLGTFRVYRGQVEVDAKDWQRDKARQVFQLLLTQRGRWLQREEIAEQLWPSLSPEAAGRDFKVALNALNRAIETNHRADAPFAFIVREGTAYRIRPEADIWVDSVVFEQECQVGLRLLESGQTAEGTAHLREALRLYAGDYLPDALYEDWASAERERLLSLFLRSAERLATAWIEEGRYDDALEVCQRMLVQDRCWEHAYRWMMVAYARQGNRALALRTYQRCTEVLAQELSIEPSPPTTALYKRIQQTGDLPAHTG